MKHTLKQFGGWHYGPDPEGEQHDKISVHTDEGYYICLIDKGSHEEAIARLIAAAPELLEALEAIVHDNECGNWSKYKFDNARAAIAKARVETQ